MTDDHDVRPGAAAPAGEAEPQTNGAARSGLRIWRVRAQALARRLFGPPPYRASIGKIAAYVTVPVFCWVFYTTSSGMIDIMRRDSGDLVGIVGAMVGTTSVLVMLAATSISLGADFGALIARRQFVGERVVMKTIVTTCVFLFVFSISAFFSFTYYYTNIFKLSSKKLVGEAQPMELAAEVILPASKMIDENYELETRRILATTGMQNYLASLDALLRAASDKTPRFREALAQVEDELRAGAEAAAAKTARGQRDARDAERAVEETRVRIAALAQSAADFEPIIKAKEAEIAALTTTARQEDQLALDAEKGLDNLGASCGPNCAAHRAAATSARKRIATIRQTLVAPTEGRAAALKQRDALSSQLVTLEQKAQSAAAAAAAPAQKEEAAPDIDGALARVTELRNQIRADPTWARIKEMKLYCAPILSVMRRSTAAGADVAADFRCEPANAEVNDLLTARDAAIAARAVFDQNCALEGAARAAMQAISLRIRNAPDTDKSAVSNGFAEAKQFVDNCVVAGKSAGLTESGVQTLLKRGDAFARSRTLDRNRFELAREAFLSFTPDATMALGVAVAQDAFMFVMKLLSEIFQREVKTRERPPLPPSMDVTDSDADDTETRVMKALLRAARPLDGDMSAFDPNARGVADLPDAVRDNLVGLLNRLVRERIAYVNRHGVYILDNRTLAGVETRLSANLERLEAEGGVMALLETDDKGGGRRRLRSALRRYVSARRPADDAGAYASGGAPGSEAAKDNVRELA